MRYFLILSFLFSSWHMQAEGRKNLNLTKCIQEIERQHRVTISYSPSVTDTIYPEATLPEFMSKKSVTEKLRYVLQGTGYDAAKIRGLIYLYKQPGAEKRKPEYLIEEQKTVERDTLKVPVLHVDSLVFQPDSLIPAASMLKGVSTWDYLTRFGHQPDKMKWSVYSNLLLLGTGSLNVGTTFGVGSKWTLGGMVSYNPWEYGKARIKHILLRPEARYWLCDNFGGHFFGATLTYARYNVGGIDLPLFSDNIKNNRYQGNLGGLGISYGYSWVLGKRINLELEIGIGVNHTKYAKYPCTDCGQKIKTDRKTFVAPDKFAINLVYVLK